MAMNTKFLTTGIWRVVRQIPGAQSGTASTSAPRPASCEAEREPSNETGSAAPAVLVVAHRARRRRVVGGQLLRAQ